MNRQIRVGKIGGAAKQFRQGLGKRTQRVLTGFARRQRLAFGRACGDQRVRSSCKFRRKHALETTAKLGRERRISLLVTFETPVPVCFESGALAARIPGFRNGGGNFKRRVGPVELGACTCNLFGAEWSAVRILMALFGGSATANNGLAAQKTRAGRLCKCGR